MQWRLVLVNYKSLTNTTRWCWLQQHGNWTVNLHLVYQVIWYRQKSIVGCVKHVLRILVHFFLLSKNILNEDWHCSLHIVSKLECIRNIVTHQNINIIHLKTKKKSENLKNIYWYKTLYKKQDKKKWFCVKKEWMYNREENHTSR